MTEVRRGMPIVVGHAGVRVTPVERTQVRGGFNFMSSGVSTEKPKGALVQEIARDLVMHRRKGGKTLDEARLRLARQPFEPRSDIYSLFTPYLGDERNEAWRTYLFLGRN